MQYMVSSGQQVESMLTIPCRWLKMPARPWPVPWPAAAGPKGLAGIFLLQ